MLIANSTLERARGSVFAEVVAQVAALAEHGGTPLEPAAEVEFDAFCLHIVDLNRLVPLSRNSFKVLFELSVVVWRVFF